jgi:hypothetical protein
VTEIKDCEVPGCGRILLVDHVLICTFVGRNPRSPGLHAEGEVQEHFLQMFVVRHTGSICSELLGENEGLGVTYWTIGEKQRM